jgi:hypothetical protein
VNAPAKKPGGGKPFQSKLEPHFDLIRQARQARKTWVQVAELIKAQGVDCTPQGVFSFFKAKRKRRYALGMEPEDAPTPQANAARPTPLPPVRAHDPAFSTDPNDSLFGINR